MFVWWAALAKATGMHCNKFAERVDECGGVDYLKQLQRNPSILVKHYFSGEA